MAFQFGILILFTTLTKSLALTCTSETKKCMLLSTDDIHGSPTSWGCPVQPKPSLSQCYKHNQKSCCVAAHDSNISSEYGALLSTNCLREYSDLEEFYCISCNPSMQDYVTIYTSSNTATSNGADGLCGASDCKGELRIYPTSSTRAVGDLYDNCGLVLKNQDSVGLPSSFYSNLAKTQLTGGKDYNGENTISSSKGHFGAQTVKANPTVAEIRERAEYIFFNGSSSINLDGIRPTYFPSKYFRIIYDDTSTACYSSGSSIIMNIFLSVGTIVFVMLIA